MSVTKRAMVKSLVVSANQSVLTGGHQNPHSIQIMNADTPQEIAVAANSWNQTGCQFYHSFAPGLLIDRCVFLQYEMVVTINWRDGKDTEADATPKWGQTTWAGIVASDTADSRQWFLEQSYLTDEDLDQYLISAPATIGAPASCPIHRVCSNMLVSLNNANSSYSPNLFHNALTHYTYNPNDAIESSLAPVAPDPCNNLLRYNTVYGNREDSPFGISTSYTGAGLNLGATRNVSKYDPPPRNTSVKILKVLHKDPNPVAKTGQDVNTSYCARTVITYQITEPLTHPYFVEPGNRDTFANIQNLSMAMTFQANLRAMWQFNTGVFANDVLLICPRLADRQNAATVQLFGTQDTLGYTLAMNGNDSNPTWADNFLTKAPRLLLRTYLPAVTIPASVKMPFYDWLHFNYSMVQATGNVGWAPNNLESSITCTTAPIFLHQVPRRIFIFARPLQEYGQAHGCWEADCYLSLDELNIQTETNQGLYIGANQQQLWQTAMRAGSQQTWAGFTYDQGSVMCLDLAQSDCGTYIPGAKVPFSFTIKAKMHNTSFDLFGNLRPMNGAGNRVQNITRSPAVAGSYVDATYGGSDFRLGNGNRDDNYSLSRTDEFRLFVVAEFHGGMVATLNDLRYDTGTDAASLFGLSRGGLTPGMSLSPTSFTRNMRNAGLGGNRGVGAAVGGSLAHSHKGGKGMPAGYSGEGGSTSGGVAHLQ